jgi:hypothetical protein
VANAWRPESVGKWISLKAQAGKSSRVAAGLLAIVSGILVTACPPSPRPDCKSTNTCPPTQAPQCATVQVGSNTTRTVAWGPDLLEHSETVTLKSAEGTPTSTSISLHGEPYLRIESALDPKSKALTTTTHFGSAFSGIREMILTTVDGQTIAGTIDGRQLQPFAKGTPPEQLKFTDGSSLPPISIDTHATDELAAFLKAAQSGSSSCDSSLVTTATPAASGLGIGPRPMAAIAPHNYSGGATEASCIACNGACSGAATGCEFGVILGCAPAAGVYGIGYAVCVGLGSIACTITGVSCHVVCGAAKPGPCCPVACGVACCGTNDTCMNPSSGLCCPADHPQQCGASVCCLATDQCVAGTATCCALGTVPCGSQCCPSGSSCNADTGQCCAPGAPCNSCGKVGSPCCSGSACEAGSGCGPNNTCVTCPAKATVKTLVNTVQHMGSNCFGNDAKFTFQGPQGASCDANFGHGTCTATPSVNNGSACTASWQVEGDPHNCVCTVRIQTPSDCSKWIDCTVVATESSPIGCP